MRRVRFLLPWLAMLFVAAPVVAATPAAVAAPAPTVSWQIQPSTASGPTTRPYFVYDLAPGGTVRDWVGVTNLGTTSLSLNVYPADGYNAADGSFDVRPAATKPTDVGNWITLTSRKVTIAPRSRVDIPFTMTIPANATPGDHAGGIVAALTSVTTDANGARVDVERRVGVRMYLRVAGALHPALQVKQLDASFSASANPFSSGSTTIRYLVSNSGNVRLAAHQHVEVAGPLGIGRNGRKVADLPELLPGESVQRTVRIASPAAVHLTARVLLDPYVTPNPAMTSELDAKIKPAVVRATTGVWAFAWWQVPVVLLLLAALAWCARLAWSRWRNRRVAATGERLSTAIE